MTLAEGIKEIITQFGAQTITTPRMVNMLSDLQAFEHRASRRILKSMIQEGVTLKFYNRYISMEDDNSLFLMTVVKDVTEQGFSEGYTRYVVESLAMALGWIDQEPICEPEMNKYAPAATNTYSVGAVKFKMVEVMGGKFSIGATPEQGIFANFDERPSVDVEVSDFLIGATPVTQELWNAVMQNNPSHFKGDSLPVERVTWEDAIKFIDGLNKLTGEKFRLPTEAEWEFAARGGNQSSRTKYAGTDDDYIDEYVWHKGTAQGTTHPVMEKKPNELGIYDMSGNVGEWCADWYFGSYAISASRTDPKGPDSGVTRIVRGGSWNDKPINCRVSKRHSLNPAYRHKQIGFRLAKDKK